MARKTKLTLVTISRGRMKYQNFFHLPLNEKGQPILPPASLERIYAKIGAKRGDTITIG